MHDFDVAVVGGGAAGLCAAIAAREAGASVVLLEAEDRLGGTTAISGGVLYAAGTRVQRERGIEDSPEAMIADALGVNRGSVDPALTATLAREGAGTLDWLASLGVEFRAEHLYASGAEPIPRGHVATGLGHGLVTALEQAGGARGVEVVLRTRVERLWMREGRVIGLEAGGTRLRTGSVVLACGGIGHDASLRRRLRGGRGAAQLGGLGAGTGSRARAGRAGGDSQRARGPNRCSESRFRRDRGILQPIVSKRP